MQGSDNGVLENRCSKLWGIHDAGNAVTNTENGNFLENNGSCFPFKNFDELKSDREVFVNVVVPLPPYDNIRHPARGAAKFKAKQPNSSNTPPGMERKNG